MSDELEIYYIEMKIPHVFIWERYPYSPVSTDKKYVEKIFENLVTDPVWFDKGFLFRINSNKRRKFIKKQETEL